MHRQICAALIAVASIVPRADAQDRVGVTLGAGGIFSSDPSPSEHFAEPVVTGSIQRVMKRHVVLEGDVTYWAHRSQIDYGAHDVSGPTGVIGRVGQTTIVDDRKTWTIGLNVLVKSTGFVRVFGGVGAALITQDTEYSQTETGCIGATLVCRPYVDARVRGPVPSFRLIGGVEVPVTDRFAIVTAVRNEANDLNARSHTVTAIGGLRISLK